MQDTPFAQAYPAQTVRIVVPFRPGSITDIMARLIAEDASKKWKQQVIVENRPGLPGTVAVARAEPDGLTLMLTSNGHAAVGYINKNLRLRPGARFFRHHARRHDPDVSNRSPGMPAKDTSNNDVLCVWLTAVSG